MWGATFGVPELIEAMRIRIFVVGLSLMK